MRAPCSIGQRYDRVQSGSENSEGSSMQIRAVALIACLLLSGCLLPSRGTPVLVDSVADDYWSGEGRLLEVSADRQRCRVSARAPSLIVREKWVPCSSVPPTNSR